MLSFRITFVRKKLKIKLSVTNLINCVKILNKTIPVKNVLC